VSLGVVLEFTALGLIAAIGVRVLYAIFEVRDVHAKQQTSILMAVHAVEEMRKLQPEFLSVLQRVESDGRALQAVALQIELSVAGLKHSVGASLYGAAERQTKALEELRDHLDAQEERLARILENISQPALPASETAKNGNGNGHGNGNGSYTRLRKEVISQDPQIRFSVLKDWVHTNTLAILHRASRGCASASELIANIPAHLEAEAELTPERVLLIHTRGWAEKVAIPVSDTDAMDHEVLSRRTDV
jgi:hypothetical protein